MTADSPGWLVPRHTKVGSRHAVASGHYLASAAAHAILEAGGNAVDAGCCAGIALAVLHADEVNFGGVAPIMIRTAEGQTVTIDGLGTWPAGIPADLFMREHDGTIPIADPSVQFLQHDRAQPEWGIRSQPAERKDSIVSLPQCRNIDGGVEKSGPHSVA